MKLRAILVDDEEAARDVLENLLTRFCPEIELVAKSSTVPEAVEQINKLQPDVVFLDIEMPNYAGYEIVNFFDQVDFDIIFVTAYDQYAVRAFEISAVDYLLKPIDINRLKEATQRAQIRANKKDQEKRLSLLKDSLENKKINNIVIFDRGQQQVIPLENLIAIEAQESYCLFHTTTREYIVSKNLKHFETALEGIDQFFRVHKSWIINKTHLKNYSKSELTIRLTNGINTKLSKYKKAEFETAILN